MCHKNKRIMAKKGVLTKADYLPYEEYKAVLNKLHEDGKYRDELYFIVAFSTALRISDILSLRWEDILGKDRITKTEQKTGKTRMIRMNTAVQNKIAELYGLLRSPRKSYFLFKDNAISPITSQAINKRLKAIRDKYNLSITNFSSHTFRKTFGRYVYEKKGKTEESLLLLCSILNHSNPSVTKRYIGLRDDEINSVFDEIEF